MSSNPQHFKPRVPEHNILVLGQTGSGKTSAIYKFCYDFFGDLRYDPTDNGYDGTLANVDHIQCLIDITENHGSEEYPALRDQLILDHQAFLLAYSVCSRASFDKIRYYYEQIQQVKARTPVSICLVGTKCDLDNDGRQVTTDEGAQLAAELNIGHFYETSAKNNTNIEEAFHALVRDDRVIRGGKSHSVASKSGTAGKEAQTKHGRPAIWRRLVHYCRRSKAART